ncbi:MULTISPECIES: anthranilate synthase component 1 [Alteromonadaceae]|uniref:Anthranilate synthase component 1 n=1 Tax=Brumicola blandensis TaxID=3075611 RepID=A0AAW8QX88_9ALTE|nr:MULTISPECIES: anthranilate synthase component 1 [unclassified Alteromonas]MDT0581134.1 anthranilate synthase component 1 [Alteromonas sp. W409]MDT0626752.1 anthranilate synthase component 1 [Alteromonas sp. W364]
MSLAELGLEAGQVESIIVDGPYIKDPLLAYQALGKENSLLLESAEIDSKANLKSLLLVDAAIRIECNDQSVTITALTANGISVFPVLKAALADYHSHQEVAEDSMRFEFPAISSNIDEDSRLKQASVFDVLRVLKNEVSTLRDHPNALFLGGVFSYDLLGTFEKLPEATFADNNCPEYVFYLAETLLLVDHQNQKTELIGSVFSGPMVAQHYFSINQRLEQIKHHLSDLPNKIEDAQIVKNITLQVDKSDQEYCEDVKNLKEHILDGDIFQVVPSRSFSLPCPSPLASYQQLKKQNPSPYMFYLHDQDFTMFGASPESALKYDQQSNVVEVYPIAGTRPRGKNQDGTINFDMDSRLELNLRQDEKEKSEHIMLVDLARNDVAKVSKPGTRHVKDLLKVDRYSHVMHLVSRVVGELKEDLDALHAYQACMNMGTLVGAPKVSAASLIREVEKQKRGSYGGAVGYLNGNGDMDTCIVIRSAFVRLKTAYIQAGAGVVNDSIPQSEADETRAKAQAVISAIIAAHKPVKQGEDK